ncbi:MAG: UbiD family decarboxylase [Chloroflexi bacterium]|nr:UbiD family decarboxylase [Chloroflexota bacterium]
MAFDSLGAFIKAADEIGEARFVDSADLDVDVGCLAELSTERKGPMLVFDNFAEYPRGYRVCSNALQTPRRLALAMGFPFDAHPVELVRLWKERRRTNAPIPPTMVTEGPIFDRLQSGDDVDVNSFPTPKWHSDDGGRYIGTADMVVMRDPEADWINVGVYRGMIQARDRISLWINDGNHGRIIAERYWAQGRAAPAAVVLGCDPLTWMTASMSPPFGVSEYDVAGAYRGSPVELVPLPDTGLPVPATAEIVLEGEIPPPSEESAHEGPFGEWPGYYSHEGNEAVLRIKRIYHRARPILLGAPPNRPLVTGPTAVPSIAVQAWEHLDRTGITDIAGVWAFSHQLMLVVALKQRHAGHAKQALLTLASLRAGGMKCFYVAVDEDIDPSNIDEVVWAMCTRVDPSSDVDVIHKAWTADLDPRLTPAQRESGDLTMGRMMIDACRPFAWRDRFPKPNVFAADERRQVETKWRDLLEGFGQRPGPRKTG